MRVTTVMHYGSYINIGGIHGSIRGSSSTSFSRLSGDDLNAPEGG